MFLYLLNLIFNVLNVVALPIHFTNVISKNDNNNDINNYTNNDINIYTAFLYIPVIIIILIFFIF